MSTRNWQEIDIRVIMGDQTLTGRDQDKQRRTTPRRKELSLYIDGGQPPYTKAKR